jgi:hypothetical protein
VKAVVEVSRVTENIDNTAVVQPRKALGYILGMLLLSALVASWFVWGPLGIVFYVDGLFNSDWVFILGPFLFLLIPAAAIFLPFQMVRLFRRWRQLTLERKWRHVILVALLAGFVGSAVLSYAQVLPIPAPNDMFARGFARHVQSQTSIEAIQDWLAGLDPKICVNEGGYVQDRRLDASELPACVLRLHPGPATILPVGDRLMVRLTWGGGLMGHRGLVVGNRDMPMPPPDSSDAGEYRVPLAPGAYFWSGD